MDGISPIPQPPKQRVSIFFVGTFIVILLLLLLVLNYFNILSLSQFFPNQLGWLPHKAQPMPSPQPTSTQSQDYTPNVFQYDTEKAKKIVSQYIKDTIKPEFISKTLIIRQGLSIDNRFEKSAKDQFGSYFTTNQATISVNFHYKESTNIPNDFMIFIQPSKIDKITLTPTLADTLTTSYLTNSYTPIESCTTKGATSYCETFKTEFNGKRGYGVLAGQDQTVSPPKPILIIFTCSVPKGSQDYVSQKSCISP